MSDLVERMLKEADILRDFYVGLTATTAPAQNLLREGADEIERLEAIADIIDIMTAQAIKRQNDEIERLHAKVERLETAWESSKAESRRVRGLFEGQRGIVTELRVEIERLRTEAAWGESETMEEVQRLRAALEKERRALKEEIGSLWNDAARMMEALKEIAEVAEESADISINGFPTAAMSIVLLARAALVRVQFENKMSLNRTGGGS